MTWLLLVLIVLVVGFLFAARKYTIYQKHELWVHHGIKSYTMTLNYSGGDMDAFDSEELGQGTILTVIDNELTVVHDLTGQALVPGDYRQFTVEGLFEKALWHPNVYYDPVYGFPQRLGSPWSWAIEVTNFQPSISRGTWRHRYEDKR